MFGAELRARQARLEAEQKARTERERQKLEKERILQERAQQRELERAEAARQKRLQQLAEEERARARQYEATEANGGVWLQVTLQVLPLDESAAQAKGIRRAKDKVVLPPSVGSDLTNQGASRNGALLFELSTTVQHPSRAGASTTRTTHAGVLDFTAPEGTVLVPSKVAACLWGPGPDGPGTAPTPSGLVTVTYRRLDKGTYVRLQPMEHGFHELVGEHMREVLEAGLAAYSTLSEGDWLAIEHGGRTHPLLVRELRPAPAVSIIDTDVEADVVPSVESEQYLKAWEERQRAEAARLEALAAERRALEQQRLAMEQAQAQHAAQQAAAEAARAAEEEARRITARAALAASLPPEPPAPGPSTSGSADAQPLASCLFRLPDGTRASRRFLLSTPLHVMFDYVDSLGAGGLPPGSYQLVAQFPRRVVASPPGVTAAPPGLGSSAEGPGPGSLGLQPQLVGDVLAAGAQEALLLEPLEATAMPVAVATGAGAGAGRATPGPHGQGQGAAASAAAGGQRQ